MGSGNPFAADSEVWRAANPTEQATTARFANSVDLHAHHTSQAPYGAPTILSQQQGLDQFEAVCRPADYSFAELDPATSGRTPKGSNTGSAELGLQTKGSSAVRAFGSQSSTPRGYPAVGGGSGLQDSSIQHQGFLSQGSTPRLASSSGEIWTNKGITMGKDNATGRGSYLGQAGLSQQAPMVQHAAASQPWPSAFSTQFGGPSRTEALPHHAHFSAASDGASPLQDFPSAFGTSTWQPPQQHWGSQSQEGVDQRHSTSGQEFPVVFDDAKPANPRIHQSSLQQLPNIPDAPDFTSHSRSQQIFEDAGISSSKENDDSKLWEFATIQTLKPQLLKSKAKSEVPANRIPMRPNSDNFWIQPWATFPENPGINQGSTETTGHPVEVQAVHEPSATLLQTSQPHHNLGFPVENAGANRENAGTSTTSTWPMHEPQPTPEEDSPPVPLTAFSPTKSHEMQRVSQVPWALPPPKNDFPRPNVADVPQQPITAPQTANGDTKAIPDWQAFDSSPPAANILDLSKQLDQGLQLHPRQDLVTESTAGDEELARQLQEQWNRENGVQIPQGSKNFKERLSDKLGLRRPSGVAGIAPYHNRQGTLPTGMASTPAGVPPLPGARAGEKADTGFGGVTNWHSFSKGSATPPQYESIQNLGAPGGSGGLMASGRGEYKACSAPPDDEAYARKLQWEYDNEGNRGTQSSANQAGWWQKPQTSQAAPTVDSVVNDEALAHRLQQEELARHGHPWQGPPGHPQMPQSQSRQNVPQPWWSGGQQPQPPAARTGYPQGYGSTPYSLQQGTLPPPNTANDQEFARQLQEQLDSEQRHQQPAFAAQPGTNNSSNPSAPSWRRAFDRLVSPSPDLCMGCQKPMATFFGGQRRTALGGNWHPGAECLRCGGCSQPISDSSLTQKDGKPYHIGCYKEAFHPRCCVCNDFCPEEGNHIRWTTDTFWGYKACPKHTTDGTIRCYACNRYQPHNEEWVQVSTESSRHLCLDCICSVVVDTQDAQPLYTEVLQFYERMQMKLPSRPPLVLVEPSAMESAEAREGRCRALDKDGNAPVFHTRGLTLSMEYHNMRTVVRNRGNFLFDVRPEVIHIPGPSHCEVTAILVLAGLPKVMAGSILAHECMHAWLRLHGTSQLAPEVEEGLCQLMALLWLDSHPPGSLGTWESRLASYCSHQIRTETSPIYGDGFRRALLNFQESSLPQVISHVRQTGRFVV